MSQPLFRFTSLGATHGYQAFMLVLCIYALGIMAYQSASPPPHVRTILGYADFAVCVLFLGDFLLSFARAENKWRYFVTWGWLDLLSSIPVIDAARWGRLARILRIFRVLRGLRAAQMVTALVVQHRAQHAVMAAFLVCVALCGPHVSAL